MQNTPLSGKIREYLPKGFTPTGIFPNRRMRRLNPTNRNKVVQEIILEDGTSKFIFHNKLAW